MEFENLESEKERYHEIKVVIIEKLYMPLVRMSTFVE
jgi:hypothetical protein